MSCKAIILAAGNGTRMNTNKQKTMLEVLGEPMLGWVLDSVRGAGISDEDIGVVVGKGADAVTEYLTTRGSFRVFTQKERRGAAHAVKQAEEMLDDDGNVLVICADMPFVNCDTVIAALNEHTHSGSDITVFADLSGNTEYAGICWVKTATLKNALSRLPDEADIGDIAALVGEDGGNAGKFTVPEPYILLSAKDRSDMLDINLVAKMAVIGKLMKDGVEFVSTDGIIIEKTVTIGRDTKILPGTILRGNTVIGENCVIGPNTLIENCKIGNSVTLNNVQAYDSRVCDRVKAGPFVQLRPGTILHDGVKIGDFVEVKNSEIGVNTAISHLTYVGDSDVGKGVNFGCGCVTANYDGINKYRTTIGDYAFIGCNTNLIAPVEIGENATTAAGSTITTAVPPDSLAVERAQTRIIEHWEKNSLRKKKA